MYRNNARGSNSSVRGIRGDNPTAALNSAPRAIAKVYGSNEFPDIYGEVRFYDTESGVFVIAQIENLPAGPSGCEGDIFGFHIHEGGSCTGNATDYFADTRAHYNPAGVMHPHHAGDMPPLFCNDGSAFLAFVTNRFTIDEIIGKTVVVHAMRDDFTTQPSGDSGEKIACGVILSYTR